MPAKRTRAKEAKAPYRVRRKTTVRSSPQVMLRWSEIESATEPIVLERNGRPVAVIIKYDDYQQMGTGRTQRREAAWQELDAVLAQVHGRTQNFGAKEIEADITAVRQEVREKHAAHRHRG